MFRNNKDVVTIDKLIKKPSLAYKQFLIYVNGDIRTFVLVKYIFFIGKKRKAGKGRENTKNNLPLLTLS